MKDAEPASAPAEGADEAQPEATATTSAAGESTTPSKPKDNSRRKSTGTAGGKKNLKKKGSMARITHLDCKPGDHYFVRGKGWTKWPGVICDEEMLPAALLKSRPVTAMRVDGTYREDVADGGKRVVDRTYPVMYLQTNEFGWVKNTDLAELDPKTVTDNIPAKANQELQAAYHLAAEAHPLDYYKNVLREHMETEAKERKEAKEAKAQATPAKKSSKKAKAKTNDDDLEMPDADEEVDSETTKKSNKRKADDSAETPQRAESVKKPKIKLTTSSTPKTTNGTASTPKSAKAKDDSKPTKSKSKKISKETADKTTEKEVAAPKEPEHTAEEKHQRKEKEVLFLRHKLQRGLLTKEQGPKEEEMKTMSDYISKLEAFPDLEVSIIRATKINKVLKAILKMDSIPKEDEFKFKPRSQVLLDQWTRLLAVDEKPSGEATNGVNGSAQSSKKSPEPAAKAKTNGVKEASEDAPEAAKDSEKKKSEEAAEKSEDRPEEKPAAGEEVRLEIMRHIDPADFWKAKEPESVAASA
ncbi:hypothetical protein CONLIGDRAFT_566910 [Coniochaeta ligniaria NRRL 30616]|uniref:PWWP domain-containing protein n=1 Tax=Coniochaeta ligniaria NRRL 30616 TaxID=1408157 RepID=A0A1J7K0X9_9PEZI|nr:hypothetical protein CONLIGDRAFT_566910 [Coniochaeta ligniaria NRRL 30616]